MLPDLAQQTLKASYVSDFMTMTQPYKEKDIEDQLINNITKFMLELGKGFAFVGRQYLVQVGESDYFIDLLFYHTRLKCYVVIELKNTKFIPEYAGKLNFYLSADPQHQWHPFPQKEEIFRTTKRYLCARHFPQW